MRNPFELVTASKLTAPEAKELWCDDTRLERAKGRENCFINGHRGTGKSMLFRVLQYDCQKLLSPDVEPGFLSVYFAVRDTEFMTEELDLFQDDSQRHLISESHFSILVLIQLFLLLEAHLDLIPEALRGEVIMLIESAMRSAYKYAAPDVPTIDKTSYEACLRGVINVLEQERQRLTDYVLRRMYDAIAFDGPLFLFDVLLGPISDRLHRVAGKVIYLLVDDGDDLPHSHTVVLNTWIARRRASVVFKVSTMFGYKTYETRSRSAIQHPHDFTQIEIATRHLHQDLTEDYVSLLRRICEKRMVLAKESPSEEDVPVEEFFPEDQHQAARLEEVKQELEVKYRKVYSGRAVRDYVYRHLHSEFMKELARKHTPDTYSYSGFRTLAILSSGMVRDFILCAQRMYDSAASNASGDVRAIPPAIQSKVVRRHADEVLEDILNFKQKRARDSRPEDWRALRKLIQGLGSVFRQKMLSEDAERRVFSFAFQDEPDEDIERLLDLAVAEGYFMKGFISRKEGTGRRLLYVLTRRLAPAFNLDVSAYSGYLSLTTDRIRSLIEDGPPRTGDEASQPSLFGPVEVISDFSGDVVDKESDWVPISGEEAGL